MGWFRNGYPDPEHKIFGQCERVKYERVKCERVKCERVKCERVRFQGERVGAHPPRPLPGGAEH